MAMKREGREAFLRRPQVAVFSTVGPQGRVHSVTGLRSKHWSQVVGAFDRTVSLCDIAREELPPELAGSALIHCSLPDPAAVSGPLKARRQAF